VALTPDDKQAVSASEDGTLKIWDWGSGGMIGTLRGHSGSVIGVAITPNGKHAVSASIDRTAVPAPCRSNRKGRAPCAQAAGKCACKTADLYGTPGNLVDGRTSVARSSSPKAILHRRPLYGTFSAECQRCEGGGAQAQPVLSGLRAFLIRHLLTLLTNRLENRCNTAQNFHSISNP
jgi:hypothetical protein